MPPYTAIEATEGIRTMHTMSNLQKAVSMHNEIAGNFPLDDAVIEGRSLNT